MELVTKPEENYLKFSDCTKICVIVEGADNYLHCYWTAEEGLLRHAFFHDFTEPKYLSTGLLMKLIFK